jgi:hypothetical protein
VANLQDLLAASSVGTRAAGAAAATPDIMDSLHSVAGVGLGAVAATGNFLDLPGSSIRDILAGENPFDQWMTPLSDENRVTGRQLLEQYGMRKNKATGISGWLSDPGEGLRDFAGFAAEIALDPFGPLTKPLMMGTSLGRAAASAASRAHPLVKMTGNALVNVFDRIPAKATKAALGSTFRGVKALFNPASEGVTNPIVQQMKEAVHPLIEKVRVRSATHAGEIGYTSQRTGFNLVPDTSLDMTNPDNWLKDNSLLKVNAREDAIYRYLEGVYDPSQAQIQSRDIVTIGDTPGLHEVERVDRTDTGAMVKLVGKDEPVNYTQLKPSFLQQGVELPDELKSVLDVVKTDVDALHKEADDLGILLGNDQDTYGVYGVGRNKSNELRLLEALTGMDKQSWSRRYNSIVASLLSPGGRDIVYKGFTNKTAGVNELFADKLMQHMTEDITGRAQPSLELIEGARPLILPDMIGIRHLQGLADSMGMDVEDLWNEAFFTTDRKAAKTMAGLRQVSPTEFSIEEGQVPLGNMNAQIREEAGRKIASMDIRIGTQDFDRGVIDDVLPAFERGVHQEGVTRLEINTTPELGDKFWEKQGFRKDGRQSVDGARETWIKDTYPGPGGVDRKLTTPRMVKASEATEHLKRIRDVHEAEAAMGVRAGTQPRRGQWSRWDDVSSMGNQKHTFITRNLKNLTEIDPTTMHPREFKSVVDYEAAMNYHGRGRKVYMASIAKVKGGPEVPVLLSPTSQSDIGKAWDHFTKKLGEDLKTNPLQQREAVIDHLHQAITRNHADRVDQWMPRIERDTGLVHALANVGGAQTAVHAESVTGWKKAFIDLQDRIDNGKPLTKQTETLLRMNDDSLQALTFNKQNIEQMRMLREQYNGAASEANQKMLDEIDVDKDFESYLQTKEDRMLSSIEQDIGVELLDRHHALAMEMAEHVEKRMAPIYSRSGAVAGHDYLHKNGSAVELVKGIRNTLTNIFREQGAVANPRNVKTHVDMNAANGMTLGEALEGPNGMFAGRVNEDKFLENMRQYWIDNKIPGFEATEDAKVIKSQIERIKGLQASADTFEQMRTLNEIAGAADLPELAYLTRMAQSITSYTKSGILAYTPATAVRDGASSFFNATVVGGMNPVTAIASHGTRALDFVRGTPVDPGEGIPEIEAFLQTFGRESTPQTRGEAFQNLWNAHHQGGSLHPNVIQADAPAMEGADSSMRLIEDTPGQRRLRDELKSVTKGHLNPFTKKGAFNPLHTAGAWTTDELGRPVKHTTSNAVVTLNNGFRQKVDLTNRALYVLDRVAKTKSLADAFAMSDKVLMNANPRNFTRFETKYLKGLIPFYSFMRQSIPMFLQELMINPGGGLGMTVRASRLSQGDEQGYVPFQYQDTAAIPIGKSEDGSLKYLTSLGLMHEDAVNYAGNILQGDVKSLLQKTISSANPALKWLVEYSTNTSLYSQGPMGGRRLDDLDPNMGRLLTNLGLQELGPSGRATPVIGPLAESLAAASPASRLLSLAKVATNDPARAGATEKVMRLLSGVRVENVTPEQITRDLRDRLNAIQIKSGAKPVTIVAGTEKLKERMLEQGDTRGAEELDRIGLVLETLRKQVGSRPSSKSGRPKTRDLIDSMR